MEPTIVADLGAPSPVEERIHLVLRLKRLDVFHQWPGLSMLADSRWALLATP